MKTKVLERTALTVTVLLILSALLLTRRSEKLGNACV